MRYRRTCCPLGQWPSLKAKQYPTPRDNDRIAGRVGRPGNDGGRLGTRADWEEPTEGHLEPTRVDDDDGHSHER